MPGITALRRDFVSLPPIRSISNAADPFEVNGIELCEQRRCGVGPERIFVKCMKATFPDRIVRWILQKIRDIA